MFLDLDGTLLHPRRAYADDEPTIRVEETASGGTFVAVDALRRVTRLAERALVVPATTRNREQYARVAGVFPVEPPWAIVSNGARLLAPDGEDERWRTARIEDARGWSAAVAGAESVAELARALHAEADAPDARVVPVDDAFVVAVVPDAAGAERVRRRFARVSPALGAATTRQGRKVYVVPTPITKESACAEVRRRTGVEWSIAAGDAALDAGMIGAADEGIVLGGSAWTSEDVPERSVRTTASGPRGTEQMLDLVARRLHDRFGRGRKS